MKFYHNCMSASSEMIKLCSPLDFSRSGPVLPQIFKAPTEKPCLQRPSGVHALRQAPRLLPCVISSKLRRNVYWGLEMFIFEITGIKGWDFDHFGRGAHTIMIELHLQVSSFNHIIVLRASSS